MIGSIGTNLKLREFFLSFSLVGPTTEDVDSSSLVENVKSII